MEFYNNTDIVYLNKDDMAKAKKLITDIYHSMEFFGNVLMDGKLCKNDVHTHMGLFESYFSELSELLEYNSIIAEEKKMRIASVKEMNQKLLELEKITGEELSQSPEKVEAVLKYYTDLFRKWYESIGFHYASQKNICTWGIQYEFSHEVYDITESEKPFQKNQSLFGKDTEFDVLRDRFHGELLDTDNNKMLLQKLFQETFPNSRMIGYNSMLGDNRKFVLRTKLMIPFSDLANLSAKYN